MTKTVYLILIHFLFSQQTGAEVVNGGAVSARESYRHAKQLTKCANAYAEAHCADFFKENPELGQYAIDCEQPSEPIKDLKSCGEGAGQAAADIKNLVTAAASGVGAMATAATSGPSDTVRALDAYYAECAKTMECKLQAYVGVAGHAPDESSRKFLEKVSDSRQLQRLLDVTDYERLLHIKKRAVEILRTEKDSPERDGKMDALYPGWSERKDYRGQSIWDMGYKAGAKVLQASVCYRSDVQAEAVCHGLATILIPGTVLKVGSRLAHIASVLARGARAEKVLERTLTAAERNAIQAAHEEDDLRKKAEILRDAGISPTERRQILENGIAGDVAVASELDIKTANANLWILENEKMISRRQIEYLRRRLEKCGASSDACNAAVRAVKEEYEKNMAMYRAAASDLESRLRKAIEAGDKNPALREHLSRIAECTSAQHPLKCNDVMASAYKLLGDIKDPAPIAKTAGATIEKSPFHAVEEMEFLNSAKKNEFRSLLAQMKNKGAVDRMHERMVQVQDVDYTDVRLNKAVERLVGKNPVMGISSSKVFMESPDGQMRVFFDPVARYFSVRFKNVDGNVGRYAQMIERPDGTLRFAAESELAQSGTAEWITQTHFGY